MTQFPNASDRVRRVRGYNSHIEPSARWHFNERDAAAVAATAGNLQPVFAMTSSVIASQLESLSYSMSGVHATGAPSFTLAFITAWLLQTLGVAALKAFACLIRHKGESIFRDFVACLWHWVIDSGWRAIKDYFFGGWGRWWQSLCQGLWSFGAWRWRVPTQPVRPVRPDGPSPGRRRPIRDRIDNRREHRRERRDR